MKFVTNKAGIVNPVKDDETLLKHLNHTQRTVEDPFDRLRPSTHEEARAWCVRYGVEVPEEYADKKAK